MTAGPGFIDPLRVGPRLLAAGAADPELPLAGITLAVKDMVDVAGVPTGAGNPDVLAAAAPAARHASAVQRLLDAGACVIGKAHTDEFAYSLMGSNAHYGIPHNPAAPGRLPGGSSSGSASAVASGVAQIAIGTDTAGSIRVPASYCGIFGLRPTHGRVPTDGVWPLAPSFDVVGPLAASGELLARAGRALLDPGARAGESDAHPDAGLPPTELVIARDLLGEADPGVGEAVADAARTLAGTLGVALTETRAGGDRLDEWAQAFRDRQMVQAWASDGAWLTAHRPRLGPAIAARFAAARAVPAHASRAADAAGEHVRAMLDAVLPPGGALVLPSAVSVAPPAALDVDSEDRLRGRLLRLTCLAGLAGAPAVSLPLARSDGFPVGVCLLARPGGDERLLAAAAAVA